MAKYLIYIAAIVLAVICGWLARGPSVIYETEVITDTLTTVDTVEIYELIEVKETVVVRDTIYRDTEGDTISTKIAELDTIFIDGARLSVAYYVAPRVYELKYKPAPREIQTVTITNEIERPREWWDRPGLILAAGIIGGVLVAK